jgi:hypothetical protein
MSGTLKVTTLQDGASSTANLTFDSSANATVGGTLAMASSFKRNRIINGNMGIDQRNAGASVTIGSSAGTYTLDRWCAQSVNASKFSVQQNAGSITPPTGFTKYLGVTSLASTSSGSTDYYGFFQSIEGFNTADLAWGTANAASVTISFWVRSSLTGSFSASLTNSGSNRSYPFSYTVNAANTWEQKTVTVAGDTSGTWLTDNSSGIYLRFDLGVGSSFRGTAGTWAAANYYGVTGAVSVVGTSGATFYITGVQLEVGTKATPYEMQIYSDQLAQCQRYYVQLSSSGALFASLGTGICNSSSSGQGFVVRLPVTMRTQPTASFNAMRVYDGTSAAIILSFSSVSSCSSANALGFDASCSGTFLTTGRPLTIQGNNDATAYIAASAEL